MHIQWFPGHMTKALRQIENELKKVEVVIYILDSRAIRSSFNSCFDMLIENKRVVYILNKVDTVEKEDIKKWEYKFQEENKFFLLCSSLNQKNRSKIINIIQESTKDIIEKYKIKGVNKTIRALVIGMPNTGKSTFINLLAKDKKTQTGNKAGLTKGVQFVKISDYIEVYDTPGTLVPSFENQDIAKKLAFIGCIKDEILDLNELSCELIKYFREKKYINFLNRYNLDNFEDDDYNTLENIAKKKGCILKGNKIDFDRVSKLIINDFRTQKIGKIMLDETR